MFFQLTIFGKFGHGIFLMSDLRVFILIVRQLMRLSLRSAFQLAFHVAHFVFNQINGECLDRCGLSGFDVDNFQQGGQMLFARFQGVSPARAASDLSDHDLRPDVVLNSLLAQAVSGGSARYSERMSCTLYWPDRSDSSRLPHVSKPSPSLGSTSLLKLS